MGKPPTFQQSRLPQQQGRGGDRGDDKAAAAPELLQKADVPLVQQHRQRLPDPRKEQAVEVLPAKRLKGPVRQDGEAVLALHRLPPGGEGDNLLAVEFEQFCGTADLLHGEQRVEHHCGFFHSAPFPFFYLIWRRISASCS